ncbi:acyltransferase [Leptospira yanagawae serovar Saopaulo str. Sao Paulo = ATCC 700523]|uniref:Acyltransferase n=2 Tax=Leptospira yanagawae TaxID=293069 RepID=A0A5E8H710_9LEPT|nr:acyltransferase [Leptospira yanagawae serovar Saopaulo str. Sao Paulo = ATCC 700523]
MFKKGKCIMEWELLGISLAGLISFTLYFFKIPIEFPAPSDSKEKREIRFDILRGFAMIGIVMIHIHSYFQFFHPNDYLVIKSTLFLSNLSRFSVPLFILTSAVFLKKKSGYWTSKFKHLILPYFFFSVFGYFIKYNDHSVYEFLYFLLFGKVFTPFYFVPLLIQFYLLFYIMNSIFSHESWRYRILIISFFINLVSNLGIFDPYLPKDYHAISILNYLFFFVLGLSIGTSKPSTSSTKPERNYILNIFLLLICTIVFIFSFSFQTDFKNHHLFYPIFMMIFVWNHLFCFSAKFKNAISYIGKQSLYIFLLHPFIIHFMHSFDAYTFGGPITGYLITLILNVGIPILASFIVQRGMILYQSRHYS